MKTLETILPSHDYTLLALIILLPLIGAAVNGVFGKRLGKDAVSLLALGSVLSSFVLSVVTFVMLAQAAHGEGRVRFFWHGWDWLRLSLKDGGSITLNVGLSVDALSGTMALVVTGVGFLIHLYSTKYMEHDPGYHRFFAYLNLFIFSMLVLILGDSLPVLFVGWEGVGLCSYLLIGFWFEEGKNAAAGSKAFITNRIGDVGLLVAMGLILYYTQALDWSGIENGASNLLTPMQIWPPGPRFPLASLLPDAAAQWITTPRHINAATLVGLSLFVGCAGKSAQIPLYVWLPDAMAGPTPVSALIHAATMVTAGVYLVCRMSLVFALSPFVMFTVALIGALTAVFAATIAFAQHDIKKVLAYSTVSQLGYMFLGAGVGAFSAGFFHVVTHAFFKACLFLGAGSVIHAMHARIHDGDASQDLRNMGGLRRYLPQTFWAFAASWAAIVGVPLTSGFFSKDEILVKAYTSFVGSPVSNNRITSSEADVLLWEWPSWGGPLLYVLGLCGAVMTAFYMSRLFFGVFFGEFRGWKIAPQLQGLPGAESVHSVHDHSQHQKPGALLEGPMPHESPWQMWVPLAILAAFALFGGLLNAHLLHLHAFDSWLEPVFARVENVKVVEGAESLTPAFVTLAVLAFALGAGGAYWVYLVKNGQPAQAMIQRAPGLYRLVADKWRVDEFYRETVVGAVDSLAEFGAWADKWIVDGILARFTSFLVGATGTALRYLQTGRVQNYAAVMVIGLCWVGWFFVTPRVEVKTLEDPVQGSYNLTAASGLGYAYRWDGNGDGQWDTEEFSDQSSLSFKLDGDQERKVRLEVKNAFGRVAAREFVVARSKPDRSGFGPNQGLWAPLGQLAPEQRQEGRQKP